MRFAVVEMLDGSINSIRLDKYLASRMKIIEECGDESKLADKVAYWDRIYHPDVNWIEEEQKLKYHFVNKKRNRHFWASEKKDIKKIRHHKEYEFVNDCEQV